MSLVNQLTVPHTQAVLDLLTDKPRTAEQTFRSVHERLQISHTVIKELEQLSEREQVGIDLLLLTAFQTLLYRYTAQDELVIATTLTDIVNQLIIGTDWTDTHDFTHALNHVQSAWKTAQEIHLQTSHLQTSEQMLETTDLQNDVLPIQVAYSYAHLTAAQELSLSILIEEAGLVGVWQYNAELFEAETIQRMARHFANLLESLVAEPDLPISKLSLLSADERHQLLVEWNDTTVPELTDKLLLPEFEAQVERTPDSIAVVDGERHLTYRELNARANQLAHTLHKRGIGPETLVGLYMERSLELMVAVLGIFKSGGAYVPLDPKYPSDRVDFMIEDSQISLLLTQPHLAATVSFDRDAVLSLDADWSTIADESVENADYGVTADTLAYVIYTSGTTGRPKGVMITHRGLFNFFYGEYSILDLGTNKRVLQFASINFDTSLSELFDTFLTGATLVLATGEASLPGRHLIDLVRDQKITHLMMGPATLATLPVDELPDVEVVIAGGEASTSELVARWARAKRFYNAYGPTEATIGVTLELLDADAPRVVIGRPMPNVQFYVLDPQLQPVPVGVAGELLIASPGLARGYLNHPELTAEKFIPHPFSTENGAKLYKTGDLVRYLADGNIEYLGRIDQQVKIRGFRIELGEIESVLLSHPLVKEALVVTHEFAPGDKRLAAYYVTTEPVPDLVLALELRDLVKRTLPNYMMPATFMPITRIPMNASGSKVDRRALPTPQLNLALIEQKYVAPKTETERLLSGIFSEVLGLEKVGTSDDFFTLGGHSLLATQVVSRIRETFGAELPVRSLFDTPTVSELAERVEENRQVQETTTEQPILPATRSGDTPLSFAQQRLWFLDQFLPDKSVYNVPFLLTLQGKLDKQVLERSLNEIVRRHEVLRTTFIGQEQPM
ncbi:MAG: non-ribosomal peptide synthetase, partial [Tumebacillaceae bacterium]